MQKKQLTIYLKPDDHARLKAKCALSGLKITEVVEQMVLAYLEDAIEIYINE